MSNGTNTRIHPLLRTWTCLPGSEALPWRWMHWVDGVCWRRKWKIVAKPRIDVIFPRLPSGEIFIKYRPILHLRHQQVPSDPPPATPTGALDILVGGFPCQPFSALGEQPGLTCPKGNLFQEIVRLLKAWQPKAFLLENVPGLLAMEGNTFSTILEALQEAGYDVTCEVCNARGLTATSRKRLFLVGLSEQSTTHTTTRKAFEFPFVPDLQLKARDVLDFEGIELSDMERRATRYRRTTPSIESFQAMETGRSGLAQYRLRYSGVALRKFRNSRSLTVSSMLGWTGIRRGHGQYQSTSLFTEGMSANHGISNLVSTPYTRGRVQTRRYGLL